MGRTRARRRARPVSPPQFGLRFTDIFLDNERQVVLVYKKGYMRVIFWRNYL